MTDKIQQNINQIKKSAVSPANIKGSRATVSRPNDSLLKVIRNEKEAAIFNAELAAIMAMTRK